MPFSMGVNIMTAYDIQALADGQLNPGQAQKVMDYIQANPAIKQYYHSIQRQNLLLREWWRDSCHGDRV